MAIFRWAVILVCVAMAPGRAAAQVEVTSKSDDQEKVRFALTAMQSEPLQLVSGTCRYSGTLLVDYPASPELKREFLIAEILYHR